MILKYDRLAGLLTLETDDDVILLGPMTHGTSKLIKEYGLSKSQVQEAVLTAFFNPGYPVNLDTIKKIATIIKRTGTNG